MSRTDPQFNLRIPAELKSLVEEAAKENKRSATSEIIARLQESFEARTMDEIAEQRGQELRSQYAELSRQWSELSVQIDEVNMQGLMAKAAGEDVSELRDRQRSLSEQRSNVGLAIDHLRSVLARLSG